MSTRGSKIQRIVDYFRNSAADEARVTYILVQEVMEPRLALTQRKPKLGRPRKKKVAVQVYNPSTEQIEATSV